MNFIRSEGFRWASNYWKEHKSMTPFSVFRMFFLSVARIPYQNLRTIGTSEIIIGFFSQIKNYYYYRLGTLVYCCYPQVCVDLCMTSEKKRAKNMVKKRDLHIDVRGASSEFIFALINVLINECVNKWLNLIFELTQNGSSKFWQIFVGVFAIWRELQGRVKQ